MYAEQTGIGRSISRLGGDYESISPKPVSGQPINVDSSVAVSAFARTRGSSWIGTVAIRLYLVERQSAIGPIGHFDWHGPQRRQLFVQWTIWFVRVREPDICRRNG